MADRLEYPFGSIDVETAGRWLQMSPEDDGPVWMLNLMKYKPVADYGEEGGPAISGREADDIYAPTAILADLGATVPLFGDVIAQVADDVAWERVAIVRYPSRASFFAMQERGDFQEQYVHKKAGMETTIVMGACPVGRGEPGRRFRSRGDAGAPVRRGRRAGSGPRRGDPGGPVRRRRGHPRGRAPMGRRPIRPGGGTGAASLVAPTAWPTRSSW